MAKLTVTEELKRQGEAEDGNPFGTYFAVAAMFMLLVMVGIYFWIDHGHQVLESPIVQQGAHLTPQDAK